MINILFCVMNPSKEGTRSPLRSNSVRYNRSYIVNEYSVYRRSPRFCQENRLQCCQCLPRKTPHFPFCSSIIVYDTILSCTYLCFLFLFPRVLPPSSLVLYRALDVSLSAFSRRTRVDVKRRFSKATRPLSSHVSRLVFSWRNARCVRVEDRCAFECT